MSPESKSIEFLKISQQFKLGRLQTESFHPHSKNLSLLLNKDTSEGLKNLAEVDHLALEKMQQYSQLFWPLYNDVSETLKSGNRIFMSGCGATGRLALVLEALFRRKLKTDDVVSFMAGGDFALIKSVESFEDQTIYGHRQLMELGFRDGDLLIATSEGGETPFVIGSAQKASEVSKRKPYFIYCNPDDLLRGLDRCEDLFRNNSINKISIPVGEMAISGSTRMQSSTALMFAVGQCLLYKYQDETEFINFFKNQLKELKFNYEDFSAFTDYETYVYKSKKNVNYLSTSDIAISILTDTTERSPTFSLNGFENFLHPEQTPSLSYLFVSNSNSSEQGWNSLLGRAPRALSWKDINRKIDLEEVYGFDISLSGIKKRPSHSEVFEISHNDGIITFNLGNISRSFNWGNDLFVTHLKLKMLLNAHSTSVMGLLGRFEGNIMTWVRPSNNKLIDRSARYIQELLKRKGIVKDYEEVILLIYKELENIKENEPIVMRVMDRF